VHSMMSSSIHEMFSILAQFQLQTSEKKTLKNNESNEKQWKKQPWTLAYILVLQAMSSPFSSIFGPDQLNFPPKWCHVYATSIWLQLVLDLGSSFKGLGCNLWLSTNKNAPFCWALDLGPLFKVALSITSQNIIYINSLCPSVTKLGSVTEGRLGPAPPTAVTGLGIRELCVFGGGGRWWRGRKSHE